METAGIEPTPRVLQTLKEILLTRFLTKQTYYTRSTIKLCSHKMHFTSLFIYPFPHATYQSTVYLRSVCRW